MKKLLVLLLTLVSLSATAQLTVDQAIVNTSPYKVGDTLSIKYTVAKGTTTPRYFWLRYHYNNKALSYVGTTFSQGTSVQTYYTSWSNYTFTPSTANNISANNLYAQYGATPWAYTANADWNVGQLTVQRTDASVDGIIATQKYIVLAKSDYTDIHKLDLAYAYDAAGAYISPITTAGNLVSLGTVTGGLASFNIRLAYPSTDTSITNLKAILQPLKNDSTIDYSAQSIAQASFNAQGIATFTTPKVGNKFGVLITPTTNKTYLNNIITVSDAYKAFLQNASVGLTGGSSYFQYPTLEKAIGHVTIAGTTFDNNDAYNIFSYVMGIDMSTTTRLPSSTASQIGFLYGKKAAWASGILTDKIVTVTAASQTEDFAYAYTGDLDYSNSTDPSTIAGAVAGQSTSLTNTIKSNSISAFESIGYTPATLEKATLSLSSTLVNGKVILTTTLIKADLAGIEVILQYDNTKLTLTDIVFDAGSTVTNFSTNTDNRITFGSIDQLKSAKIKVGTPYKLIFTPKETLTNTAGLFYTVLSDAVDITGKKINLIVE
jgi:hypothetical protein